jgi:hypothetical protein
MQLLLHVLALGLFLATSKSQAVNPKSDIKVSWRFYN